MHVTKRAMSAPRIFSFLNGVHSSNTVFGSQDIIVIFDIYLQILILFTLSANEEDPFVRFVICLIAFMKHSISFNH